MVITTWSFHSFILLQRESGVFLQFIEVDINFDMYHFPIEDKNENYLIHQILASFDILVQFTWIISDLSLSIRVYFLETVYMVNHVEQGILL